MAEQTEIQETVHRIQAKLVRLEAVARLIGDVRLTKVSAELHEELLKTLRAFEAHSNLPPQTIRPFDGDPKPPH